MKTAIAISATMRNVFSVAKSPPATVTASQMARITPRIVPMIRPMYLVCAQRPWHATVVPADAGHVMTAGQRDPKVNGTG
jgi:hypothetical protein